MDQTKLSPPQESKLHFLDYWRIIRIRKTVILAVFLLVVITATVVTFLLPEYYASTARIRIERDQTDISPLTQGGYGAIYDPTYIQTEFEVIQSEVVLSKVVKALDLNVAWGKKYNNGQPLDTTRTIEILKKHISLNPTRLTSLIEIRVMSSDKEEAARLANAVANAYREHRLDVSKEHVANGIAALEQSLKTARADVDAAQFEVDKLRADLKISDPDPMSTGPTPMLSLDAVKQLQLRLTTMEGDMVHMESKLEGLRRLRPAELRAAIQTAIGPDSELNVLLGNLNATQEKLTLLEADLGKQHPSYVNTALLIRQFEDKVNERVLGIMLGLQNNLEATKASIEQLRSALDRAKQVDVETAEKSRPYYQAKQRLAGAQHFAMMLNLRIEAEKTSLSLPRNAMVTITDNAIVGDNPVRPNKLLNIVLGIVIGLVVGIGLAFFIEYLDTSVKTIDDVERTLQAPVLGVIPQNVGFLIEEGAESPHAEAYRVLRTNLLFSRKDERLNTVAIVSAGAGEGKSTTVFNLATVFAQNGDRVVIVDSDLRRPTLHKMLRVTNSIGLTNYLLKQNTLDEVIQRTPLPTLDFMASGRLPSSSMGILSSAQMRALISDLKQRYDFVFFDSPPIMGVSDASILASEVDITLQVIQYRRYPQPMNIRAKQMIEKVGSNLLGIILNNINMSQDESYYYYSGYYHEYYSKNEESEDAARAVEAGKSGAEIKQKY